MTRLHENQLRKLLSYDAVRAVETDEDNYIIIHLEAGYSWSDEAFMHTNTFATFNNAVGILNKRFKK